jgi:hypothetical protein
MASAAISVRTHTSGVFTGQIYFLTIETQSANNAQLSNEVEAPP